MLLEVSAGSVIEPGAAAPHAFALGERADLRAREVEREVAAHRRLRGAARPQHPRRRDQARPRPASSAALDQSSRKADEGEPG